MDDSSDIITISVCVGVPHLIAVIMSVSMRRNKRKTGKLKEEIDYDEKLFVMLTGKFPQLEHSPSSEYDFIDHNQCMMFVSLICGVWIPTFWGTFKKINYLELTTSSLSKDKILTLACILLTKKIEIDISLTFIPC